METKHFSGGNEDKKGIFLQLLENVEDSLRHEEVTAVTEALRDFRDVFEEPTGLPPSRSHDHAILLKQDAKPICLRRCHYPYFQKEEIEKIVRELLEIRIIKPSQSPFSSLVLLVQKAVGCGGSVWTIKH